MRTQVRSSIYKIMKMTSLLDCTYTLYQGSCRQSDYRVRNIVRAYTAWAKESIENFTLYSI